MTDSTQPAETLSGSGHAEILTEISRISASSPDFGEVFPDLAEAVSKLVHFDRIVVWVNDISGNGSAHSFSHGVSLESRLVTGRRLDEPEFLIVGAVFDPDHVAVGA